MKPSMTVAHLMIDDTISRLKAMRAVKELPASWQDDLATLKKNVNETLDVWLEDGQGTLPERDE